MPVNRAVHAHELNLFDIMEMDMNPPGEPIEGLMWPDDEIVKHFGRMEGSVSSRIKILGELCYCLPCYIKEILVSRGVIADRSRQRLKGTALMEKHADEIFAMVRDGASCRDIACRYSVDGETVRTWLAANGCEDTPSEALWRSSINDEEALQLYESGITDAQAAELYGVSRWAMTQWRADHGIATRHSVQRRNGDPADEIDAQKARQLYENGGTDREVAEVLGTTARIMLRWRKKNDVETSRSKRAKECRAARKGSGPEEEADFC